MKRYAWKVILIAALFLFGLANRFKFLVVISYLVFSVCSSHDYFMNLQCCTVSQKIQIKNIFPVPYFCFLLSSMDCFALVLLILERILKWIKALKWTKVTFLFLSFKQLSVLQLFVKPISTIFTEIIFIA